MATTKANEHCSNDFVRAKGIQSTLLQEEGADLSQLHIVIAKQDGERLRKRNKAPKVCIQHMKLQITSGIFVGKAM